MADGVSRLAAWVSGLAALSLAGCGPGELTATPECRATVLRAQGTIGGLSEQSMVIVVDSALDRALHPPLLDALETALRAMTTGDRDGDGLRDFATPAVLRVAVLRSDGTPMEGGVAPPRSADATAVMAGGIETWPGEDAAWDAWFVATVRARVERGLAADPTEPTPIASAIAFGAAHPAFSDAWTHPAVVVLSARDEVAAPAALGASWLEESAPYASVLLVGAVPTSLLPPVGVWPDYGTLLGAQAFDESSVSCTGGIGAGEYPRGLLASLQALHRLGGWTGLASSCEPSAGPVLELLGGYPRWTGSTSLCLPRALPTREDGTVECSFDVLLPASGPRRRCADHGLDRVSLEPDDRGASRERCAIPQLTRAEIASRFEGAAFFYDDFSPHVFDTCGPDAYALQLDSDLPSGADLSVVCHAGSAACGFDLATGAEEPTDAGAPDAR